MERSQITMVEDPSKISGDNLNNIRCEAGINISGTKKGSI
jgi:hypothetical protein